MKEVLDRRTLPFVVSVLALAIVFSAFSDDFSLSGRLATRMNPGVYNDAFLGPVLDVQEQPKLRCGSILYKDTVLKYDLLECEEVGLYIGADNIELDCDSHTISGKKGNKESGIVFGGDVVPNAGFRGITIKNCNIYGFDDGVNAANVAAMNNIIYNNIIFNGSHGIFLRGMNNTIHNNLIYNTANGIVCQKINDSLFYNNRLLDNGVGIDILWMHHNNFYSNIFSEGSIGVYIIGSQDNIFTNNNFTKNSIFGLYMSDTNDNLLNNNTFEYSGGDGVFTADSSDTYYDNVFRNNTLSSYESMGNNHWNLTNLGNYWDDFSSNPGYPNYYEIPGPGDGIDWHPQ